MMCAMKAAAKESEDFRNRLREPENVLYGTLRKTEASN